MTGVKLYEDVIASTDVTGSPTPLSQSTLHHMFEGGWLWIIPFNNHPYSTNTLCSVGLQFDIDKHVPQAIRKKSLPVFSMSTLRCPSL